MSERDRDPRGREGERQIEAISHVWVWVVNLSTVVARSENSSSGLIKYWWRTDRRWNLTMSFGLIGGLSDHNRVLRARKFGWIPTKLNTVRGKFNSFKEQETIWIGNCDTARAPDTPPDHSTCTMAIIMSCIGVSYSCSKINVFPSLLRLTTLSVDQAAYTWNVLLTNVITAYRKPHEHISDHRPCSC